MNRRLLTVLVVLAAAGALLVLNIAGLSAQAGADATVRVVHAVPDAPPIQVWVDDTLVFTGTAFQDVTSYISVTSGTHMLRAWPVDISGTLLVSGPLLVDPLISATVNFVGGYNFTVGAIGTLTDIDTIPVKAKVLFDSMSLPASSQARVRLVNFALGTPALDVSVSGEPIPLWNSVPYEGSGGYVDLPAGTYTLEANAGTGSGTLLGPPLTFNAGTVYSVFAVGWFDSGPGGTLLVPLSLVLAVDKGPIIVYMPIVMRDFTSP